MQREDGAALVEFAMVLTLLTMILFGIIEFGRVYNAEVTLTHASREGVRVLAITGDAAAAAEATRHAAPSLDPTRLSVSATACLPGFPTELTATYPFPIDIPFFGARNFMLDATAVMRCSG
ncbi:MAG: pilus assembly protein [Acidimicrobiia bacterium]|nr:pilus assembly protein [Acidimicrobiia bacterium]